MRYQLFTLIYALSIIFAGSLFAQDNLPLDAQPGKCYAQCSLAEQYEVVTEQILLKEAATMIEIVPAEYQTVEERVLVKEGYKVLEIVPPSYGTVQEEILVKEAGTRLEYVPAVFETVTEQVLVSPASTKWVKGKSRPALPGRKPRRL